MRWNIKPVLLLVLGITVVSFALAFYQVGEERRRLQEDLEARAETVSERLQEALPENGKASREELQSLVDRFVIRERLTGAALLDDKGSAVTAVGTATPLLDQARALSRQTDQGNGGGAFLRVNKNLVHLYTLGQPLSGPSAYTVVVVQDAGSIDVRRASIWRNTYTRVLVQMLLVGLTALLVFRWSVAEPIRQTVEWMRRLRSGRREPLPLPQSGMFQPLAAEVSSLAKSLEAARDAAAKEAHLRDTADSMWTAERLAAQVRKKLQGSRLLVVSNREPYMHRHGSKGVEMIVPASGLVTALEPVLRASSGTWIAHGSGDADRETADERGRLRVPPDEPHYTLRRVWLDKEEEQGYYFGFANEGLWPLCHIAHTRPIFRAGDWDHYQAVNRKFADAVAEEVGSARYPFVLVQDYHFALLPRLLKKRCPQARVAIFWHIPWPNPEAFGICPWQRELLDGMLGADLLGFHIQEHCNNFLETVDKTLESRISWERFSVQREGHTSVVQPFPISVDVSDPGPRSSELSPEQRAAILAELGNGATRMGVGVDRVDYTKGILERFRGLERFFEKYPIYQGHFTFVQIGAPSRTEIKRYHDLFAEVEAEAERVNARFRNGKWKPIVLRKRHHSHQEIAPYYRAADLCLVTSLHDGMNLVAKEFLAARNDERGVLILSRFTGAARELHDALTVNPYDAEELADAIRMGLEMNLPEQRTRMQRMRRVVKEYNIYRWAGNLISELAEIRMEAPANSRLRAAAQEREAVNTVKEAAG